MANYTSFLFSSDNTIETDTFYAVVTDSVGYTVTSNTVTITVYLDPTVSIIPASMKMDYGQTATFSSTTTQGINPYTYYWLINGQGYGGSQSTITLPVSAAETLFAVGNNTVLLEVYDTVNYEAISNTVYVWMNAHLQITIVPTYARITTGQQVIFNATVTGGTPTFSFQWYLNGTFVSGGNSRSWTWVPTRNGTYTVYTTVTDSAFTPANVQSNSSQAIVGGLIIQVPPTYPNTINIASLWQYLNNWNLLGFLVACWTVSLGSTFYLIISLMMGTAVYLRTKNIAAASILWLLLGWLFVGLIPQAIAVMWLLIVLGAFGLLYKLWMWIP
jgi:hypothetical protein